MALTTFQDLTNVETIMHDLSAVVARQDLPAWRLTHPLCAAGAAELISCLKLSAHQLQEAAQHPFSSSLRHVSRVECSTRQAQTQAPLCPSWTASLPQVVAKLSKLVHLSLKVVLEDPLPVPVGGCSMLTRLDLHFEPHCSSVVYVSHVVPSADVLPPGVSLPALRAASFTCGHMGRVDMQAAHIAAFAPQLQQLHVRSLRITPASATPGQGQDPSSSSSSRSNGAAGPPMLPFCTNLACIDVAVEGFTSEQEFGPAFAAVFPVLEVVALLLRFRYPAARPPLEVLMYAPIGLHPSHEEVPSAAVLSCCTSLRAIKIRSPLFHRKHWCGGNLSSLAALTKLTRLEMRDGWFDTAAVTELGALTSLRALWLPEVNFPDVLPVVQQLPRLRNVVVPARTLCGKCFAREQAGVVSLFSKCGRGFEVVDVWDGCEHFPHLQACMDEFLNSREAADKDAVLPAAKAPPAGAPEFAHDSGFGIEVWGEYDEA